LHEVVVVVGDASVMPLPHRRYLNHPDTTNPHPATYHTDARQESQSRSALFGDLHIYRHNRIFGGDVRMGPGIWKVFIPLPV
jgi:hypothetical protein